MKRTFSDAIKRIHVAVDQRYKVVSTSTEHKNRTERQQRIVANYLDALECLVKAKELLTTNDKLEKKEFADAHLTMEVT